MKGSFASFGAALQMHTLAWECELLLQTQHGLSVCVLQGVIFLVVCQPRG